MHRSVSIIQEDAQLSGKWCHLSPCWRIATSRRMHMGGERATTVMVTIILDGMLKESIVSYVATCCYGARTHTAHQLVRSTPQSIICQARFLRFIRQQLDCLQPVNSESIPQCHTDTYPSRVYTKYYTNRVNEQPAASKYRARVEATPPLVILAF